ncbi:MAG: hypothetical protein JWN98_2735 [Abditibacteriota bacterium]|nr:hypothetical protein [Abditibacteriota bacterium]
MNPINRPFFVQRLTAAQTRALRGSVLRPNRPFAETHFSGDDDATTIHAGAVARDEAGAEHVIGVASFYHEALPMHIQCAELATLATSPVWRLRGMAVEPERQGQGIGRAILEFGIAHIADEGGGLLWCNARSGAVGFYRIASFVTCGKEFEIPDVGPHFVMVLPIDAG